MTKSGFTLLELIVTLIVMGVVASIALPNYALTVEKSHRRDAETQLLLIHSAQQMYASRNNGNYWGPAVGATAELKLANINQNLGLNILTNGKNYDCILTGGGASQFACTATRVGGSGFTVTITQADTDSAGVNPSCAPAASCP